MKPGTLDQPRMPAALRQQEPPLWRNPRRGVNDVSRPARFSVADVEVAEARLARFAPALAAWSPELAELAGIIESPLFDLPEMSLPLLGSAGGLGRVLLKADHLLPVAGSIKARERCSELGRSHP